MSARYEAWTLSRRAPIATATTLGAARDAAAGYTDGHVVDGRTGKVRWTDPMASSSDRLAIADRVRSGVYAPRDAAVELRLTVEEAREVCAALRTTHPEIAARLSAALAGAA